MTKYNETYEMSSANEDKGEMGKKSDEERTLIVKFLVGLCVILCVAVIVCAVAVIIVVKNAESQSAGKPMEVPTTTAGPPVPTPKYQDCTTANCKQTADSIRSYLNESVDPCDDFYEYVCGSWIAKAVIPDDQSQISTFQLLTNSMNDRIRVLVTEDIKSNDVEAIRQQKLLYKGCMNTEQIETLGLEPFYEVFRMNDLEWPLINITTPRGANLTSLSAKYQSIGLSAFVRFGTEYDPENFRSVLINVQVRSLTNLYSKADYSKQEHIEMLRQYYNKMLSIVAPGKNHTQAVEDVIDYEKEAAALMYDPGKRPLYKDSYRRLTLRELGEALGPSDIVTPMVFETRDLNLGLDDAVFIYDFNQTLKIAKHIGDTDSETLLNMLGITAVQELIEVMPRSIRAVQEEFDLKYKAVTPSPRWKQCLSPALTYAVTRMYSDKYFPIQDKYSVDNMILIIKAQLQLLFSLNDWMDIETKKKKVPTATLH